MWWEEDAGLQIDASLLDRRLPREGGETISKTLKTGSAVGVQADLSRLTFPHVEHAQN